MIQGSLKHVMIAPSQIWPFLSVTPLVIVSKVDFIGGTKLIKGDGICPQGPQAAPIYLRAAWGPKPCLPPAEQARLVQVHGGSRLLGDYSLETFRG